MTNQERIEINQSKGFILVAEGDGFEVYKKENGVGGWAYYSDHYSNEGFLPVFDDCFMSKEELIAIAKDAYGLELK